MALSTPLMGIAVAAVGVLCGYQSNIFTPAIHHHRHDALHLQDDRSQNRESSWTKDCCGKEPDAKGKRVGKKEYGVPKLCPQFDGLHCFETLVMR